MIQGEETSCRGGQESCIWHPLNSWENDLQLLFNNMIRSLDPYSAGCILLQKVDQVPRERALPYCHSSGGSHCASLHHLLYMGIKDARRAPSV